MKIAIIIKEYQINSYENLQFRKNAQKLGIDLEFLFDTNLSLIIETGKKTVLHQGHEITSDVILPRCGSSSSDRLCTIIDALKENKKLVINDGECIKLMKDKFSTLNVLAANNIDIIKTLIIHNVDDLKIVENNFKFPIVKKMNTGSYGNGIYLIKDSKQLEDFFDFSQLTNKNDSFIFQEFIDHKFGEDLRIYMFRDQVIGTMRRKSDGVDFKANYTLHKNSEPVEITPKLLQMCQDIMKAVDCDIAGIDILETENGYVVCEVNSAPGFLGMENTNPGLNVSKEIFKNIKKLYENQ